MYLYNFLLDKSPIIIENNAIPQDAVNMPSMEDPATLLISQQSSNNDGIASRLRSRKKRRPLLPWEVGKFFEY